MSRIRIGMVFREKEAYVRADCAYVKLEPDFKDINTQMMGVGELGQVKQILLDDMSIIGRRVLRVGRTTGLRRGTIVALGMNSLMIKKLQLIRIY